MAKKAITTLDESPSRPAMSPENREQQMIERAISLAEKRMIEGTASSQEIVHYLRLGSTKNQLEIEKLRRENALLKAKEDAIRESAMSGEIYEEALRAFRTYAGADDE